MRIGSLFSGYGGLDAGVRQVLGGTVVWHSDIEPASVRLLAYHYPDVPNLGDITAVDWAAVEPVDVLTGGFPCQDLSMAGKRLGLRPGTRSGLWEHMAYAIDQLRPSLVVIENVRGLLSARAHGDVEPCPWCVGDGSAEPLRALGAVLGDLAGLGYDARWVGLRAADVGAPHGRFRVFIAARDAPGRDGFDDGNAQRQAGDGRRLAAADALHSRHRNGADTRGANQPRARQLLGGSSLSVVADSQHQQSQGVRPLSGLGWGLDARPDLRLPAPDPSADAECFDGRDEYSDYIPERRRQSDTDWGTYAHAIHRWERILGRVAPSPTTPGKNGQPRLSAHFVEWMQGLPDGHVTAVPGLTRNEQLKLLGNGVVPAQAAAALRHLLAAELVAA